jgi:hypothetical protein
LAGKQRDGEEVVHFLRPIRKSIHKSSPSFRRIASHPMAENPKTQRFNGHQTYSTIQFPASQAGTLLRLLVSRTSPETTNLWSSPKYGSRIWWFSREDLWFVVSFRAISKLWFASKTRDFVWENPTFGNANLLRGKRAPHFLPHWNALPGPIVIFLTEANSVPKL